jgi:hypothetical protein
MPANSPQEVDELIAKALSSGDLETALSLYEDDAVFIPPGAPATEPVRGKEVLRPSRVRVSGVESDAHN